MHTKDVFTKYPHFDRHTEDGLCTQEMYSQNIHTLMGRHTQESKKRKYAHIEDNGLCKQEMFSQKIHTLIGTQKSPQNANIHTWRLMVYAHKRCIHKISTL
jgi:hypothetical protein